ncbi:MAG TPA: RDD family protein [Candidatus Acidoferrales bacterium]|nr:RDD family protein [Candidatus Acidoferrales bacterium]
MYCSKCGTAIEQGAAFCSACGQPVNPPFATAPNVPIAGPSTPHPFPQPYAARPLFPQAAYAGFWLRLVAHLIDGLLAGIAFSVVFLAGIAAVGLGSLRDLIHGTNSPEDIFTPGLIAIIFLFSTSAIVMMWIYYAWMESSQYQGTLGKMALGLYVTDLEGRQITFARASGRYFSKIITGLIPLGIGYMMAGFTEKKQALHDIIAGCLVLRKS